MSLIVRRTKMFFLAFTGQPSSRGIKDRFNTNLVNRFKCTSLFAFLTDAERRCYMQTEAGDGGMIVSFNQAKAYARDTIHKVPVLSLNHKGEWETIYRLEGEGLVPHWFSSNRFFADQTVFKDIDGDHWVFVRPEYTNGHGFVTPCKIHTSVTPSGATIKRIEKTSRTQVRLVQAAFGTRLLINGKVAVCC